MTIHVSAGLGQSSSVLLNEGETVGSLVQRVAPAFNMGTNVDAVSNGVVLSASDILSDGMQISLSQRSHSKAW
jgi:hypothetical protein